MRTTIALSLSLNRFTITNISCITHDLSRTVMYTVIKIYITQYENLLFPRRVPPRSNRSGGATSVSAQFRLNRSTRFHRRRSNLENEDC